MYASMMDANSISRELERFQGETVLFAAKCIKSADNFWLESQQLFNDRQNCWHTKERHANVLPISLVWQVDSAEHRSAH